MFKNSYEPTFDNVLVEQIIPKQTNTGIFLVDEPRQYPAQGKALKVGPGTTTKKKVFVETEIKVGDVVYWERNNKDVNEIILEGKKYFIVPENLILGCESE
jgi:co-chaperonin GroES (HSP10)